MTFIVNEVFLAMHYTPHVDLAFNSMLTNAQILENIKKLEKTERGISSSILQVLTFSFLFCLCISLFCSILALEYAI